MSEKASIIGKPAAVLTENKDPDRESSIWNNRPEVPSTVNTEEPEDIIPKDPVIPEEPVIKAPPRSTMRPFLTTNSFAMCYTAFPIQQLFINIKINRIVISVHCSFVRFLYLILTYYTL